MLPSLPNLPRLPVDITVERADYNKARLSVKGQVSFLTRVEVNRLIGELERVLSRI